GRGEEKKIQATTEAFEKAMAFAASRKPDTFIIASPHSVMYADYFHISPDTWAEGDFRQFRARDVRIRAGYDAELVHELCALCDRKAFPAGTMGERDPKLDHGTMIPLYFLNRHLDPSAYRIVRIGLSGLPLEDHYRLGQLIREAAERLGRRVFFIASGDLSHKLKEDGPYGFDENGPAYDDRIMDVMGRAQFDELLDFDETFCDRAAECGHRSFVMMAGALDGTAVRAHRLSHEGTFGVGYGICTYEVTGEDEMRHFLRVWSEKKKQKLAETRAKEDLFVRLARAGVECAVRRHRKLPEKEILEVIGAGASAENEDVRAGETPACAAKTAQADRDALLNRRAGVFVSIHKNGRLRGCIGTISPTCRSIAEEIARNAVSASTQDPRFPAIRPSELDALEITVDVLGDTEPVSSPSELDVKRYGVIVTKGRRRGLLLPNLEGVDTVREQIEIALQKAGLDTDEENYSLERFEVVRHY
ncbi:MAG: AmmeMemoRadiSam system protein A, partial [Eubacteriales bacterium]|nr:AmmeMemoRadiSam system protein A [Eubacteriales bacterium]